MAEEPRPLQNPEENRATNSAGRFVIKPVIDEKTPTESNAQKDDPSHAAMAA